MDQAIHDQASELRKLCAARPVGDLSLGEHLQIAASLSRMGRVDTLGIAVVAARVTLTRMEEAADEAVLQMKRGNRMTTQQIMQVAGTIVGGGMLALIIWFVGHSVN